MKLAWYPWQLFVRKWDVLVPILFGVVVACGVIIWMEHTLRTVSQPVFVHYSVELGVDAVGRPIVASSLGIFVLVCCVVNTLIANALMLSSRAAARIVLWSLVPLAIVAVWFAYFIIRVNGA